MGILLSTSLLTITACDTAPNQTANIQPPALPITLKQLKQDLLQSGLTYRFTPSDVYINITSEAWIFNRTDDITVLKINNIHPVRGQSLTLVDATLCLRGKHFHTTTGKFAYRYQQQGWQLASANGYRTEPSTKKCLPQSSPPL